MPGALRVLQPFESDPGGELMGEWPLRGFALAHLQELFGATDEMYDSYRVRPAHVARLERATGQRLG